MMYPFTRLAKLFAESEDVPVEGSPSAFEDASWEGEGSSHIDCEIAHLTKLRSGPTKPVSTFKMLAARECNLIGRGRFSSADRCHVLSRYLPVNGPYLVDQMDTRAYVSQFSSDGSFFVAAYQGSRIRVYNVEKKWKVQKDIHARSLRWTITDTCLSPDKTLLVYSSMSPIVHYVDVRSAVTESLANVTEVHEQLNFAGNNRDRFLGIFSLKFSRDGRELVAASNDKCIYIYDLGEDKLTFRMQAHEDDVNTVCFADESGNLLYSGGDDNLCKVWDRRCFLGAQSAGILTGHIEGVTSIDSRGDGRYFISNGKDQTTKLWDIRKMSYSTSRVPKCRGSDWDYRYMDYPEERLKVRHPNDQSLTTYKGHSVLLTLINKAMLPKQPPCTLPTHLLFVIVLLYSSVLSCQKVCDHRDQSALLTFTSNISVSSNVVPLNWTSGISCCEWEGVECDLNGRIIRLQLPSRSLKGIISSSINNLVMLTHLNLSNNYLHGSLEEDISWPKNLRVVDLSSNAILGSIPREIGKLMSLKKLHLHENNFSGPIPSSLMKCSHLVELFLRDNNLNGDISRLDFSKLVHLQKLDFRNNSLSGALPKSIYSCKSLIAIRISENNLSGQISPKLGKLQSLSFLSLSGNSFTNITMTLRVLAKCKNLTFLSLGSNFYGESLPIQRDFISLGEYPILEFFMLRKCKFKPGPVPNWLSKLKNLRALSMGGGNNFQGRVPYWLGDLPKLFTIGLIENSLCGELPQTLWHFPALISQNTSLDLEFSQFELPIFFPYGNMQSIRFKANYYRGIFLSYNKLIGTIPKEIGSLQNVQQLLLDHNQLSGHIPYSISNLRNLEKFDLSTNKLTGEIPTSLTSLSFLSYFNVSYNDLEGLIPTGGQFESFERSDFEGNPKLCGKPLNRSCYDPATPTSSHDQNKQPFLEGLLVGYVSAFFGILIVVTSYVWFYNVRCAGLLK